MTYEQLALLRSLAVRPSRDIAPSIQSMVSNLQQGGYVKYDSASGWVATAEGCRLIESRRTADKL
jgi:Mn-dependent DtxR family transcriptional regulator